MNRNAREDEASQDTELVMLMEMGFDERQAQLAMEQNDGKVDDALDDLLSGKVFAEPKDIPTEAKRDPCQDDYDDQVAHEKRYHHPGRAASFGVSGDSPQPPPRHKDEETKKQTNQAYPRYLSSSGLESSPPPPKRNDTSTTAKKDKVNVPVCTSNDLGDENRVGAVAMAGPDLETGDYHPTFDSSEEGRHQAHQTQQSLATDTPIVAELVQPPEAVMVSPPEVYQASVSTGHGSKQASTPYWTRNRILLAALIVILVVGAAIMGTVLALNKQDNDKAGSNSNESEGAESAQDPTQQPMDDMAQDPATTEGPIVAVPTPVTTEGPTTVVATEGPTTVVATEGPTTVVTTEGQIIDPDESTQLVTASESAQVSFGEHVIVSRDGSTIVSGAPTGNYVEVFRRSGVTWDQIGQRLEGDSNGDQFGRCVDLNADGSMLIVGAWNGDDSGQDSGHAKVFRLDGDDWGKVGQTLKGDETLDRFGWYVTMSDDGSTIAISAREADPGGMENAGHVRVFTLDGDDEWNQLGPDIEGETEQEEFGRSVAMSSDGRRLAIGTTKWNQLKGIVRVFDFNFGNWNRVGQDLVGDSEGDFFGSGVSLSKDGSILAIGADGFDTRSGLVRAFRFDGSVWTQYGGDILADGDLGALGMHQVALSNDGCCLVAGASRRNSGMGAGYIYVFENDGWKKIVELNGYQQNDRFGESVSISGDCKVSVFGAMERDYRAGYFKVYTSDHEISC